MSATSSNSEVRTSRPLVAVALLAGIASLFTGAATAAPSVSPGYFQSRNILWSAIDASQPSTRGESMHFAPGTHPADQDFMSATFFPLKNLQISALTTLQFDMFLAAGSTCGGGSPRLGLVLEDPANAANPNNGKQILIYPYAANLCTAGAWHTAYGLYGATWDAGGIGGANGLTSSYDAHQAARNAFGDRYRISRVRLYFDASGPEAWFDSFKVNALALDERAKDTTPEAWQPDPTTTAQVTARIPTVGFFQSRNARWALAPQPSKLHAEALHFSPATRTEDANFMATSFFPQGNLQLPALARLKVDTYYAGGTCGSALPRFVMIIENPADTTSTQEVEGQWTGPCVTGQWQTMDVASAGYVSWSAFGLGVSGGTRADVETAARNWNPAYRIRVVRLNISGDTADVWVDNERINDLLFVERAQDGSPASQVPNPGKQGDGFVANVTFPAQQAVIANDGAVVLTADANRQIKVRVRPYLDGHADPATGAWTGQDGIYAPGYDYNNAYGTYPAGYSNILNVAFYANGGLPGVPGTTLSTGQQQGLTNVGNGYYEGVITLPAGFQGGVYTVVVNDNYPKTIPGSGPESGTDNRASYFFLPKELLLRSGDASVAGVADLMDTPSAFTGPIAGFSRGYEGPRSPVIIAPLN